MYLNIKILTTKALLIAAFFFFSFSPAFAQYKLELEWQKEPGGKGLNITSITKSDNDSLLYVASANRVRTVRTFDGEVTKIDTVETAYNLLMSRDGKTLVAAGGFGVGLLDPQTFKRIYWDSVYLSDLRSLSHNEKQNKYLICGNSISNKNESFIRIYDMIEKKLVKEFNSTYFPSKDQFVKQANITDDGKNVVYGYDITTEFPKNTFTTKHYLKMIDLEGKVIKDFGETSSPKFNFTVDGKTLIYFMPDAMHFLDLATMQEREGIPFGSANPDGIEMGSDGKFMLLGGGLVLYYFDLETKKYLLLNDNSSWSTFKLSFNNSSLFYGSSRFLIKFNVKPTTSVIDDKNKLEFKIQVNNNDLVLTSESGINSNLTYKIISIDSKIVKNILPNEAQIISNGIQFDISNLQSGAYFLQISDDQNTLAVLKFLKVY